MRVDKNRVSGFYWVRFEGQAIVAEYTADGLGCSPEGPHWHVPLSEACYRDREVCELLSARIPAPAEFGKRAELVEALLRKSRASSRALEGTETEATV